MRHRVKKAFTLVEILIVVVILGILAAIVVPQFTNASTEAQAGNVATQLQTIRSQIELYRVRNNGAYPPALVTGGEGDVAWADLTDDPNADYMRDAPVNPRTRSSSVVAGTDHMAGDAETGWIFDEDTGNIFAAFFNEDNYNDDDAETLPWEEIPE